MPTRVFKTAEFARFAAKARIADALLVEAIERVERGLVDADLGGGVLKLRIARPNEGCRDGFWTIVACELGRGDVGESAPTARVCGDQAMRRRKDRYRNEAMGMIHRSVAGLHRMGAVDDATMRHFDEGCLVPEFVPADLKALREREGASRADLAWRLGVSAATVGQWESGKRKPSGPALRLLSLAKAKGLEYIG